MCVCMCVCMPARAHSFAHHEGGIEREGVAERESDERISKRMGLSRIMKA